MKPRVYKINKHRSFEYYTPEDVERMLAEERTSLPATAALDAAGLDAAIHLAAIGDEAGASKALLAWAERAQVVKL